MMKTLQKEHENTEKATLVECWCITNYSKLGQDMIFSFGAQQPEHAVENSAAFWHAQFSLTPDAQKLFIIPSQYWKKINELDAE